MKHYTVAMQDLFGLPPAHQRSTAQHNLFFGLMPDDGTRDRMERVVQGLRERNETRGRWLNPARYHLTLHFLGTYSELPQERVADACRAAGALRLPAFELALDRAGHFSNGVGWLGCATTDTALQRLWEELRRALAHERVGVRGHASFIPHVTVLRDARSALPATPIDPVTWPVREFVLVDSVLGASSEYRLLGRWALD